MNNEDYAYLLLTILMAMFLVIFFGVEFFNINIVHILFVVFGIPITVTTSVFWYDIIVKLFKL